MDQDGGTGSSRLNSEARKKRRAKDAKEKLKEKVSVSMSSRESLATTRTKSRSRRRALPQRTSEDPQERQEHQEKRDTQNSVGSKTKNADKEASNVKFDHIVQRRKWLFELESESSASSVSNESIAPRNTGLEELKVKWDQEKDRHKLKILATLLPDEILRDPISRRSRAFDVALLFPDVSGFTELCQKYDKTGKGGPSRLTEVLNGYIGSMIKIVLARKGDVCKFGGDAFLCAWKVTEEMNMSEVVNLAIDSAVDIQKNCGEHTTDVGVKLRVKMAVSAGKVHFSIIGTSFSKFFVLVGPPVMEVRDAEQLCKAGDIIVTPSAWKYVTNYMLYSFTYHPDGKHIKVHDFGPLWKSVQFGLQEKGVDFDNAREFLKDYKFPFKIEDVRPFIIPPVMRSIDLCRSLDHLTEMRQVAIAFFNIAARFDSMTPEQVIKLSNQVFQVVSTIVTKAGGAVNKLTLFDKDMAVLTVFGLKGFKHELASLIALQSAYTCIGELESLDLVSASAGVTTGMAYCGVIGHPLRKEYTMMGHAVNMAARLMCAYRNIVSTDRNTFLHSKLESSHFEVLEYENLKGIQSTEPFYKFHLNPRRSKSLNREDYPILGRDKQIEGFENFLADGLTSNTSLRFMIIFGKARIGKSRLVARLIKLAEQKNFPSSERTSRRTRVRYNPIEVNVISLAEDVARSPYGVVKLIFVPLLGLLDSSSIEERADKILSQVTDTRVLSYLAAFNVIFNVNFDLTPQYLALSQEEQHKVRMYLLNDLYSRCFSKNQTWLIVIEDAEFMDDESWNFLVHCSSEPAKALYLMTVGQRRALSSIAADCLDRIKAEKITLTDIDKWFYTGLACQILGVRAIPVELENLLQSYKSSGNPGWLESFLISLIQSKSIYVAQVSSEKVKAMKLVAPPEAMLLLTVNKKDGLQTSNWMDTLETFESFTDTGQKSVRVCLLGPNFKAGTENEGELTMDVMFIKMMDMLKPLEQMILKVASVLGNNIQRKALQFIISKDTHLESRQLARAIKNLFEIKILTCAKGDSLASNVLVSRRMVLDTSIRKGIICECKVLEIPADCKDLPKYANCAFMRFKSQTFRDTVYNLLLDEQKKKFHSSCIEFLRKTTTRCKSCESVPFNNILGIEVKDEMVLVCPRSPMHGVRSTRLDPKPQLLWKRKSLSTSQSLPEAKGKLDNELGLIYIPDKGDCQCTKILSSVYSVLLDHAVGFGRKDIKMEVLLEYASVSLTSHNIPLTMQILDDALILAKELREDKEHLDFCSPYIYAKVYSLMGAAKLNLGRLDESLDHLKTSLYYMNERLPQNPIKKKILVQKACMKLKTVTEIFPEKYIGSASEKDAPALDLLAECFGLISIVEMYLEDWMLAKYTALRAMATALLPNRNFFGLCLAYTDLIDVSYHSRELENSTKLELSAIQVCNESSDKIVEIYEWEAIGRLYRVIFKTRHMRAEIEEAVQIGFQSVKIASVIRSMSLKMDTIPGLIFALVQLDRLSEAVVLIKELEFLSHLDSDQSSKMWYYTICLDFQLYTGFTIVSYEVCENFLKSEEDFSLFRDPNAKLRLYTSLWLWCIRNNEWELIKSYGKIIKGMEEQNPVATPFTVFVRLERLEGFLIYLVHKIDAKSIHSINMAYSDVHNIMKILKKDIKVVKVLRPRYQVLVSYYRQIRYRDESYQRLLNQAQNQAEKMKDKNLAQWIIHLRMVWSNAISPIQRDFWNEHCRKNLIEWHESDRETKKSFMYSLPLPK